MHLAAYVYAYNALIATGYSYMRTDLYTKMGEALRSRRRARGWSQPDLAGRLGRARARISELEGDLLHARAARDRLNLLVEACDALDLVPILVPRERVSAVERLLTETPSKKIALTPTRAFDDLFVDLSEEGEDES